MFWSCAKRTAWGTSDLDLAIIGESSLSFKTLATVRDAFSEINIPYKVNVLVWANIREMFMKMARKDKIVIQPSLESQ